MTTLISVIILCGLLGVLYGIWASKSVMNADPGNDRMQEIASAIQEGAGAYLKRQYATIAMVGVIIFIAIYIMHNVSKGKGARLANKGTRLVKQGGYLSCWDLCSATTVFVNSLIMIRLYKKIFESLCRRNKVCCRRSIGELRSI